MAKIRSHRELDGYQLAFLASMEIYQLTKQYPKEEMYSLTDQIRRSSRSVCANISEGFRKRKYPKMFVSKMMDSEGEASETRTWLEYSLSCQYIDQATFNDLDTRYDQIIGKLVVMGQNPEKWTY